MMSCHGIQIAGCLFKQAVRTVCAPVLHTLCYVRLQLVEFKEHIDLIDKSKITVLKFANKYMNSLVLR